MAAVPDLLPALVAAVRRLDAPELAANAAGALQSLAVAGARVAEAPRVVAQRDVAGKVAWRLRLRSTCG